MPRRRRLRPAPLAPRSGGDEEEDGPLDPEEPGEHYLSLLSLRIKSFSWLGIGFLTAIELVAVAGAVAVGGLEEEGDAAKNKRKQCSGSIGDGCSGSGSEGQRQQCSGLAGGCLVHGVPYLHRVLFSLLAASAVYPVKGDNTN